MPEIQLQGSPLQRDLEPELLSLEERIRRLPVPRRPLLDQRASSVQVWRRLAARLTRTSNCSPTPMERRAVQLEPVLGRLVCQLPPGRCLELYDQLRVPLAASTGSTTTTTVYVNDNWHVTPRLTLNLGLRYDGLPHAFERYNKFANFVPADYDTSLGNPVRPDWHA